MTIEEFLESCQKVKPPASLLWDWDTSLSLGDLCPLITILAERGGWQGFQGLSLGLCFGNCIYAGIPVQIGRAMHPSRAWKLPVILGALVPQLRAAMIVKRGLGGAAQIAVLYPTPPTSHLFPAGREHYAVHAAL